MAPSKTQWIATCTFPARALQPGESAVIQQSSILLVGTRFHSQPQQASSIRRTAGAWSVFLPCKPLLLCRAALWKLRAKLLRMPAICNGCWQYASYPLPLVNVRMIVSTEIRMAVSMLRARKIQTESWSAFFQRRWRFARTMLSGTLPSLAAQLTASIIKGQGTSFDTQQKPMFFSTQEVPYSNMLEPEVAGPLTLGRPRRWERVHHDYYGAGFPSQTEDRNEWKRTEAPFVQHLLRCWRFLMMPSSKSETA